MAQPVFYQTLNMVGVDPTLYYTNVATAGGSVTPEYPAPPFIAGTRAFGSDGSEFIFVQASTSISLTDFVIIESGTTFNDFMANSSTTTLALAPNSSQGGNISLGSTGLVLKQSVSFIPAAAFFWACTKGAFLPATTSTTGIASVAGAAVALYTTATAGVMSTTASTAGSTGSVAFAGVAVVSSISISIASSVVPAGLGATTSNGFTVGPVVALNSPRTVIILSTLAGGTGTAFW